VRRRRKPRGGCGPARLAFLWTRPGRAVEDLAEQEIIQQIPELDAKGMGLSEIARELDEAGLQCRQAKQWHHWQVRNVLRRA
jgi:hypothetical protein